MKEARDFIEQAATRGNAMAQYEMRKLGSGFADKIAQYRYQAKWLKLSADQGYAPAQIAYGSMFRYGGPSVTQKIFSSKALKGWPDDDGARRQWKKDQHIKWAIKALQKPNWIVGRWGAVEEDGKGGYQETTGLLGNACSDHDGRGYATFSFKNNELIAYIIGNTATTIMFDGFKEKPASYTALDDTHVAVYPAQWVEGWLMLERVKPEVLKVIVQGGDSSHRNFFLKPCDQ